MSDVSGGLAGAVEAGSDLLARRLAWLFFFQKKLDKLRITSSTNSPDTKTQSPNAVCEQQLCACYDTAPGATGRLSAYGLKMD